MTVGELKELLKELPEDMPVVTVGHFGESVKRDPYDFEVKRGPNTLVDYGWQRDGEEIEEAVFNVSNADIGEIPF